jgi:hypothetical protein
MCYIAESSTNMRREIAIVRIRTVVFFKKRIQECTATGSEFQLNKSEG